MKKLESKIKLVLDHFDNMLVSYDIEQKVDHCMVRVWIELKYYGADKLIPAVRKTLQSFDLIGRIKEERQNILAPIYYLSAKVTSDKIFTLAHRLSNLRPY